MIEKYKYFTYNIRKFKGSRLTVGESNLRYFKNLKYDGFTLLQHIQEHQIIYKIDLQTIRKLKLKQLSDISKKTVEFRILHLMKASKERDVYPESVWGTYSYTGTYGTSGSSGRSRGYRDDIDKDQIKERQKYQANQYNQKLKYGRK
jgi:hypothetical protein